MLSPDILAALFPRAPAAHLEAFAAQAPSLLPRFGLSAKPVRLHFFLAQMGHESGGLTIETENMNYSAERLMEVWPRRFPTLEAARPYARNPEKLANFVYADRMGNGPPASGDGFRYRGHGYMQLTGRDAFREVGALVGLDLEADPSLACAPAHALLVACGFWQWKTLNPVCDTGDFVAVTRIINGGTNGLADRKAWLDKVRRVLATPPGPEAQPPAEEAIRLQRRLQALGYREVGAADGVIGPRTLAAIARFRQENGLPAGGLDKRVREALGLAGR
ncbi:MAG: peptidoglycan-binding protein [Roseococcus sp.]|nr:peptidoglycan-binding protein [Roseococcus sp.]